MVDRLCGLFAGADLLCYEVMEGMDGWINGWDLGAGAWGMCFRCPDFQSGS